MRESCGMDVRNWKNLPYRTPIRESIGGGETFWHGMSHDKPIEEIELMPNSIVIQYIGF